MLIGIVAKRQEAEATPQSYLEFFLKYTYKFLRTGWGEDSVDFYACFYNFLRLWC